MTAFGIHEMRACGGTIALSPMPGRGGTYDADLSLLVGWQPQLVISMTEQAELPPQFHQDLAEAGIAVRHFPVVDYAVPVPQADWASVARDALAVLDNGDRVLVHCMGGCGRSGMAVLRLMIAGGEDADAALTRMRDVRPCAVETEAQLAWAQLG